MEILGIGLGLVRRHWQRVGPYVLVELLLPGGSLLALLLFLYRNRGLTGFAPAFVRAATAATRIVMPAVARRPAFCLDFDR
jgi:hypothetical protein